MMLKRIITGILILISLTACVTKPQPQKVSEITWNRHKNYIETVTYWHTQGLIGIRKQNEANSANFDWRQCGKNYEIHLFGPFGASGAVIVSDGREVTLTNNKNQTFVARTPEALLKQQTNLELPISHLYYWLRGIPAPKIPAEMTFNTEHRLENLSQAGWMIKYVNYDTVKGVDLPHKITIEYPELNIKVVIQRWLLNACE